MSEMFAFDNMRGLWIVFVWMQLSGVKEERTDSWKEQKNAHGFLHVMEGRDVVWGGMEE